jgi:SMI1/KNR4 family protein SUKH-1
MASATDQLIDSFASKLKKSGVPVRPEENSARLSQLEARLPNRLPQSFESLLSRYSFPSFEACGISFFSWESGSSEFFEVASAAKGSLSELLLPSGYIQIGRPGSGDFDAVCFDLNDHQQNREYPIVRVSHEEILCNSRIKILQKLWHSFRNFIEHYSKS